MVRMITFHSREGCEALTPNGNMALIEITDVPNNYIKTWEQWNNKISISFFDADCVKFPKATWETHRHMLFTKELAKQILDFVGTLPDFINHIVVHCEAGVSRSAAVARFLADHKYNIRMSQYNEARNMYVYMLLWQTMYDKSEQEFNEWAKEQSDFYIREQWEEMLKKYKSDKKIILFTEGEK